MAKLDDAPIVELLDIFDDEDFVGPPEKAFKRRSKSVQSSRVPSSSNIRNVNCNSNSNSNNEPIEQGLAVDYTPSHPSSQRTPARRGRPPKNSVTANSLGRPAAPQAPIIDQARPRHPTPRLPPPSTTNAQPIGQLLPEPRPWTRPQIRFGGLPNFHTSPLPGPAEFATMLTSTPLTYQQPTTSSISPITMPAYAPRIPSILSSNSAQPAHRGFKPPSDRANILRGPRVPAPAHTPQPTVQQPQPHIRTFNRNFKTNSYQFVPQSNPVRSAQEDLLRQITSMSPNLNINNLLHRVLTNQAVPTPNEVEQDTVREIKRQLEESMMSFTQPNVNPPANNVNVPLTQAQAVNALTNQQTPAQKKISAEEEILKQDEDAGVSQDDEFQDGDIYSDYKPAKLKIGLPHPDPVVETSSLSVGAPPDITYELTIPTSVINSGLLSQLQLETITYASQQHEQLLADGKTRRGFLIGDGAGVGKGRTIAGIIYENFLLGRRKSIWLSVSPDLKLDAERDLRDIGAKQIPVHSMTKQNYGRRIDATYGVIFSTYSGLVSRSQSVKGPLGSRMGQLIAWLGPNFDGVIVFDECHKAKNISVSAKKKQSKTADFALEFQNKLPAARIVYASATGASETRHLGYMTRLGLWGEGTPYTQFQDFCSAIERRGMGAMELVAVDLKMRGAYLARQLSFKTTSFDIRIANLDEKFVALYDQSVDLWSKALQRFTEACYYLGSDKKQTKRIWTCFWGAHQKFFKYLCIGAKVPLVVQIANEALKEGKCVVIGLQSTGEAKTLEALEEGDINEFVSTAKATFESLVENHFPAPPRSRTPASVLSPHRAYQDPQDTQGSSTDLSSTTVIDETFHSHEVVKFCAENGLARAELEEDKAAHELKQSTSRMNHEDFKRRKLLLEDLAKGLQTSPTKSNRSLRARKRAKARCTRRSRIRKPIDDSETEISTPTSSSTSGTTNPSPETSETTATDETYSESDDIDTESTLKNSTDEGKNEDDELSSKRAKRPRKSQTTKANESESDSDSDIIITAMKPRRPRFEVIILSSDDDEDEEGMDPNDPMVVHGEKLTVMKDELLKMIEDLGPSLPHNTLDDLINQLGGPDRVAEMTGRKGRVVKDEDGSICYRHRNETDALDSLNIAEKERFMKGEKLVAIISEAASSGISLQADRRAGNQLRRVHITIELPWSADRAIQQFGRTHRSNQVCGPEYVFVISELSGEKRFASVVAKRLQNLGALTHGDRQVTLGRSDGKTGGRNLEEFNLSGRSCRQALEKIKNYIDYGQNDKRVLPDYGGNFLADARQAFLDSGLARRSYGNQIMTEAAVVNVNHFLNRLLGMKVRIQNSLFKFFAELTEVFERENKDKSGGAIWDLTLESEKITCPPPEDYFLKTRCGIVKCSLRNVRRDRGISWNEAKKILKDNYDSIGDDRSGFYANTLPGASQMIFLLTRVSESVDHFWLYKPNMGRNSRSELFGVLKKGKKLPLKQAENIWQRIYQFTSEKCVHLCYFNSCKRAEIKGKCDAGIRYRFICILSGGILTAWPLLEKKSPEITEKVQLARLEIDSHNRIIGPVIPQQYVTRVKQILSEGSKETVVF